MTTYDWTWPAPSTSARLPPRSTPAPVRGRLLFMLMAACLLVAAWPTVGRATELAELEEIIDEARLTFARFVAHPHLAWFRERLRDTRAIFIAPRVTRASYLLGGTWGTGVLLVRDPSTRRWSEPAFYSLAGASFGLQMGALTSEVVAVAATDHAAAEMMVGAFTLGVSGALGAGRMGGGVSGSLETTSGAGLMTLTTATGLYVGVALGGTLVLVRDGANELYYGQPVELSDLQKGRVRQWYSERLMRAVADATSGVREPVP